MLLQPCDIFFTKGDTLLGYMIRRATREKNEPPTWAGHVGMIVEPGEGLDAVCIEALNRVERHTLDSQYAGKAVEIRVYRPLTWSDEDKIAILVHLEAEVGERYGYAKIALHGLKWLTGWNWWLRLAVIDRWPICSYLIADATARRGYRFGIDAKMATPDDMMDYCHENVTRYSFIGTLNA